MSIDRTQRRRQGAGGRRKSPIPLPILVLVAVAIAALGYTFLAPSDAVAHPPPRAEVSADRIQPPERYADDPRIAEVYRMVAEIPHIIDGIYCYCHCSRHSSHYSLLTCFEDDHGARCEVCLQQAELAYRMHGEGRSLDEIRQMMDQRFGSGH